MKFFLKLIYNIPILYISITLQTVVKPKLLFKKYEPMNY